MIPLYRCCLSSPPILSKASSITTEFPRITCEQTELANVSFCPSLLWRELNRLSSETYSHPNLDLFSAFLLLDGIV